MPRLIPISMIYLQALWSLILFGKSWMQWQQWALGAARHYVVWWSTIYTLRTRLFLLYKSITLSQLSFICSDIMVCLTSTDNALYFKCKICLCAVTNSVSNINSYVHGRNVTNNKGVVLYANPKSIHSGT